LVVAHERQSFFVSLAHGGVCRVNTCSECIEAIAETADKEWNFYFKLKPREEMHKRMQQGEFTFDEGDRKRVEILLSRFAYRNTAGNKEKPLAQDETPVHSLALWLHCLVESHEA
jgi:hypothetical protein